MNRKLINIALLGMFLTAGAFTVSYYWSYWEDSTSTDDMEALVLPKGHPDISQQKFPAENAYCLSCHQGIEPARPLESEMMKPF